MASLINKARKPKFELHLRVYDLNNVPLVSGVSQIKWHLPHSIHGEHRGRTEKRPIANHKVEYGYGRVVPLRIHIDRANSLEECPIEFEVWQEFGAADDKIVLGKVTLNLSEYVEESEAILRQRPGTSGSVGGGAFAAVAGTASAASAAVGDQLHHQAGKLNLGQSRKRSSTGNSNVATASSSSPSQAASGSPNSKKDNSGGSSGSNGSGQQEDGSRLPSEVREGVIRRHLMQDSKINSTLKIGILMIQIDGDRNFVAPPLRTAPVFGGIAGLGMTGEQVDQDDASTGHAPTISRSRDTAEIQDMYRTSLTAAIASPPAPGELAADACIEDIFGGGTGFADPDVGPSFSSAVVRGVGFADDEGNRGHHRRQRSGRSGRFSATSSLAPPSPWGRDEGGGGGGSPSSADDNNNGGATLRPRDVRSFFNRASAGSSGSSGEQQQHQQQNSKESGGGVSAGRPSHHRRQRSNASDKSANTLVVSRSRSRGERDRDRDGGAVAVAAAAAARKNGGVGGGGHHSRAQSRARSGSLASLATTTGGSSSDHDHRGRDGFRRAREVDEFEVRDDLVAWRLPGKVS